jgi:hypothetical protein
MVRAKYRLELTIGTYENPGMWLPRLRLTVQQAAFAGAAVVVGLGATLIYFSRLIGDQLFGPARYADIRFVLPAGPEVVPLPTIEAGEWQAWVVFPGPYDLSGAAWSASLVDLASHEVMDLPGYGSGSARSYSSDGAVGVGVGRMRVAGGHRYGLRVVCEGERCSTLRGHRPTVLITAPPGPRKSDGMRVIVQQVRVASVGLLLVVVGSMVGLATVRARYLATKSVPSEV